MNVDIYHNHVLIEGTYLARPRHISPMDWLEWWERAIEAQTWDSEEVWQRGYNEGWHDQVRHNEKQC